MASTHSPLLKLDFLPAHLADSTLVMESVHRKDTAILEMLKRAVWVTATTLKADQPMTLLYYVGRDHEIDGRLSHWPKERENNHFLYASFVEEIIPQGQEHRYGSRRTVYFCAMKAGFHAKDWVMKNPEQRASMGYTPNEMRGRKRHKSWQDYFYL